MGKPINLLAVATALAKAHCLDTGLLLIPIYEAAPFHETIADKLEEAIIRGRGRVIVNLPPRHGKSELISRVLPAWYLGRSPNRNVICVSHTLELARTFSRRAKSLVDNPYYQLTFGVALDKSEGAAAHNWGLTNGSRFLAAGVGGAITGYGADLLIIDDPIKDSVQAQSATYRERLKDWFREVALPRLTPTGTVIVVMTRWHFDDLTGWLLRDCSSDSRGDKWELLRFPAIQDTEGNPLDPRPIGAPLWASRFDKAKLDQIEQAIGTSAFAGLYQQIPALPRGQVFDIEHFRQDFELDNPPAFQRLVASWDTAYEAHARADYSVGTVWGDTGQDYCLVDLVRGRWKFPELKRQIFSLAKKHNCAIILVEASASGKDVVAELQATSDLPIIGVEVGKGDKVARASAITGRIEAGRVRLPKYAPWLQTFLKEVREFPAGEHDDIVDSMVQAIRWLTRYSSTTPVIGL
jgi:predicted phage terminase large subunit-like protein